MRCMFIAESSVYVKAAVSPSLFERLKWALCPENLSHWGSVETLGIGVLIAARFYSVISEFEDTVFHTHPGKVAVFK